MIEADKHASKGVDWAGRDVIFMPSYRPAEGGT